MLCLLDHALEDAPECRLIDGLVDPNHRLRIGDLAAVDPTEGSIRDVPGDLPLQLLEAPLAQVLEHE